jgi:hypothetical protein
VSPRPEYGPDAPLWSRYQAKADELGIGHRTIRRWAADYRRDGEAGLVDTRTLRGRVVRVDVRWDDAVHAVLAETVADSTPTRSAVLARVNARLDATFGPGVVARPSTATAYRRLAARLHLDLLVHDVEDELVRLESLGALRLTPTARREYGQIWYESART